MEYDPELGSGHSIFLDVFVGGGLLSLIVFVVLVVVLTVRTVKLLRNRNDAVSFAVGSLFLVFLLFAFVGEDIDSSPFGFTFWALVTMLSLIRIRPPEKLDPAFQGDSLVVTSTG
jgi:O-antigen ligase